MSKDNCQSHLTSSSPHSLPLPLLRPAGGDDSMNPPPSPPARSSMQLQEVCATSSTHSSKPQPKTSFTTTVLQQHQERLTGRKLARWTRHLSSAQPHLTSRRRDPDPTNLTLEILRPVGSRSDGARQKPIRVNDDLKDASSYWAATGHGLQQHVRGAATRFGDLIQLHAGHDEPTKGWRGAARLIHSDSDSKYQGGGIYQFNSFRSVARVTAS
ncbi:hypothetical protein C8J57DRAFT_1479368 [Mycena rebaudengoi]|nr:hypothetical protein C8J57DRAFT_1479368 [Mycena rebaudengoi]